MPGWVRDRSIRRDRVEGAVRQRLRAVRWLDRVSRPRFPGLAKSGRLEGALRVLKAAVLAIRVPGSEFLAAFSVAGAGLGILRRDGLFTALAAVLAALALLAMTAVLTGAWTVLTWDLPGTV